MSEKILADRYRLIEQIGVGGMAIVYRAVDTRTGHDVAVKVLRPEYNQDAEFVSRFQREAEAASQMTHHNIVNLLDVGMDGDNRYLIMEYVRGKTLKQIIQEKGRLNPQVAVQIAIRILSALQHAHERNIIHRDIKPQNILVHADGHVKVSDFGIARMANSSTLTKGDIVIGSVHYFSPEQASGQQIAVTSDIYSVGVTLYEMLTGRVPFDGETPVAIAMQHLHSRPTPIEQLAPDVPPAICRVCMTAMEKNPTYRYQSAVAMAQDLRKALEGRTDEMQFRPQDNTQATGVNPINAPQTSVNSGTTKKDRPGKKLSRLWLWVSVAVTALVIFLLYVGSTTIYHRVVNTTDVPDLLGMEVSAAERAASKAGLQVEILEVNHPSVSSGLVILQAPEEGTSLHKGDTVVITVSKGPSALTVPGVVGKTLADAKTLLQNAGLVVMIERTISTDVQTDFVMTQTPEEGSQCLAGDTITLIVSGGVTYMPFLSGLAPEEALELITENKLYCGGIAFKQTDDPLSHGLVIEQNPIADTQLLPGSAILMTIGRHPDLMHRTELQLSLPELATNLNVRVTLTEDDIEYTIFEGTFAPDSPREPIATVEWLDAGTYPGKVRLTGENTDPIEYEVSIQFE